MAFDLDRFDPFDDRFKPQPRGCLDALRIALWALRWAFDLHTYHPAPGGLPGWVFCKRGAMTIGWVGLVGGDAPSYGAVAGPLLAAAFGATPEAMAASPLLGRLEDRLNPAPTADSPAAP